MVDVPEVISDQQYASLKRNLKQSTSLEDLYKRIVNGPFNDKLLSTTIDLGIVVLLLVDEQKQMIQRVALSDTELAQAAVKVSAKPFRDITIPLDSETNIIAQAIRQNKPKITEDWKDLFIPALTPSAARLNQVGASIETSLVHPINAKNGGALIFSFYQPRPYIGEDHEAFAANYAAMVSQSLS